MRLSPARLWGLPQETANPPCCPLPNRAGPCISTDTACSSSLVAAHLASTGLQNGEAEAAVAGAINIMLDAATTAGICQLQVGAAVATGCRRSSGLLQQAPPHTPAACAGLPTTVEPAT